MRPGEEWFWMTLGAALVVTIACVPWGRLGREAVKVLRVWLVGGVWQTLCGLLALILPGLDTVRIFWVGAERMAVSRYVVRRILEMRVQSMREREGLPRLVEGEVKP